jgi:hypothetical protein
MEKKYWIGRKRAAMGMARGAASAQARLLHYELAGYYSIKAAQCRADEPGTGENAMLHLPNPALLRPAQPASRPRGPEARSDLDSGRFG